MKKATLAAGLLALGAFVLSVQPASATPGETPKILLHVGAVTTKNACTTAFTNVVTTCDAATLTGGLYPPNLYFVYVATYTPNFTPNSGIGVTGCQFGLSYQDGISGGDADGVGVDIFSWTLCATLEFVTPGPPSWPGSGGGNLITWNGCQVTFQVNPAGYFYMGAYSSDTMKLIPRPVDGIAKTADCSNAETEVVAGDLGFVAFGGADGCNPCMADCGPVPVQSTTWSSVKSLMRN